MNGKNGKTAGRLTAVALAAMLGVSLGMVRPVQAAETDWRAGNTLSPMRLGRQMGKRKRIQRRLSFLHGAKDSG